MSVGRIMAAFGIAALGYAALPTLGITRPGLAFADCLLGKISDPSSKTCEPPAFIKNLAQPAPKQ